MALLTALRVLVVPDKTKARLPGLLLVSLITFSLLWLAKIPKITQWGLGSLTLAILVGIVLGNSVYARIHPLCDPGVQWAKQYLLRWGIILYGFRLSFQQVASIGFLGIAVDLTLLVLTFLLACWVGKRWLQLGTDTVILIGAGNSICGAAAIMATAPVAKASGDAIAVAVSTVVIFGTASMFLSPWLYYLNIQHHWIEVTPQIIGLYLGSTIHEVAQVVAAGHAINEVTENIAVVSKLLRVMMLAPFLLILGFFLRRTAHRHDAAPAVPLIFPWFALGFIVVAAFNSLSLLPPTLVAHFVQLDNMLLMIAMLALGLTTRFNAIRQAGTKPLVLALILFIWLAIGGAGINLFFAHLFGY
ncbi:YeiH family protein [Pectobacterium cacticida]|uniref:YeiH family protein n=1 Tax=Pectobacterium cacticida TaxID=69221 RepID=A0ABZ2G8X4_9GAMM|nr:YeiH family protein [Pectobacterium cacticida]UYX08136.1 YeiH family protein [Pectobacterium cacticida]